MRNLTTVSIHVLTIAISSFNIFSIQFPAKANLTFDVRYLCITEKYRVETNGSKSGQLKYAAYQGSYRKEDIPNRKPDLVLYSGQAYYENSNKNNKKLVMTWKNSGDYTYQLSVLGPVQSNNIPYPQSGNLIVKHRGRIILQQNCRYIGTMEVTEA